MKPTEQEIQKWIETAKQRKSDYLMIVYDIAEENEIPVYCEDFQMLHAKYHEYHDNMCTPQEIIRILHHDGGVERNLEFHNLL